MVPSLTEMRRAVSRRLRAISRPAARTALSTSGGAVFGGFRAALPRCRHGLAGSRLPVGKWHRRSVEHRGLLPHQADPAGDRVVYQNMLAFQASVMAVDPAGSVYLAGNDFVQKLSTDGATVLYTTRIGRNVTLTGLAADAPTSPVGRLGSGFQTTPGALQQTPANPASGPDAFGVRLKPQGAIDYATYLGGSSQAWSDGIAVDALGAAFIIGAANSAKFPVTPGAYLAASGIPNFSASSFLARLSPDGSALIYSTFTDAPGDHAAAVALDAAGNAYLASFTGANYPVKNSLAACDSNGSSALTVLDGNGNVLQSTYIPGSSGYTNTTPAVGLGVDSTVYVVGSPTASSTPTQQLAQLSHFAAFPEPKCMKAGKS